MNNTPELRFQSLELSLPPAPAPQGVYKSFLQIDKYVYVSGHGPLLPNNTYIKGSVGIDMDKEAGKLAARQVGLAILATLKANLGSLDKIDRVVKVLGMVACASNFKKHPYVINGCSELFAQIFGADKGIGVRSAVGMNSLPEGIPVEIEALFLLK